MTRRVIRHLLLLFIVLPAMAACNRNTSPNILIISVASLRPDRLGVYGNQRGLTPFIDELAQRGTVFSNAFSTSSADATAIASLLTSRDPRQHMVMALGARLDAREHTLAEVLQENRYLTAGFSANERFQRHLGFAQGFAQWESDAPSTGLPAGKLRVRGMQWVLHNPTSQPILLFFHFTEPSQPYLPAEAMRKRVMQPFLSEADAHAALLQAIADPTPEHRTTAKRILDQLYDGEVITIDDELRRLFADLNDRKFFERAIVVLTADHGEEILEHGENGRGRTLFDEVVRIPLIVVAPGFVGGRRVQDNVSLLDIAPTLLDLAGISAEPRFIGESLLPFMEPDAAMARQWSRVVNRQDGAPRDLFFRLDYQGFGKDLRLHRDGIRRWNQKLLIHPDGTSSVYDLEKDPGEQVPNPPGSEGVAQLLRQTLEGQTMQLQRRMQSR